jgi:hypothetical protein
MSSYKQPQPPLTMAAPVLQPSSSAEILDDFGSDLPAELDALRALLKAFRKARERFSSHRYEVETFLEYLNPIIVFFEQPERHPRLWRALIESEFFSFLQYDLRHLEPSHEAQQTYRAAIFDSLMGLFQSAEQFGTDATCEALARSSIFTYICQVCPATADHFPIDRIAVLCALLRVRNASFAEVLTFVHSHSDTQLLADSVIRAVPPALKKFLSGQSIECDDHHYQGDTWFYGVFIASELNSQRDVNRFPEADFPAFSMAVVLALSEWLRPDSGYDPAPVLDGLAPALCLCFEFVLHEARDEVKRAAMPVLVILLEHVWPPETAAAYRSTLAGLVPYVIVWIEEDRGPVYEATSRFIALLIPEFLDDDGLIDFTWVDDKPDSFLCAALVLRHPVDAVRGQAMKFMLGCLDSDPVAERWGLCTEILGLLTGAVIGAMATADDSLSETGLRWFELLLDLGPYHTGGLAVKWPSNLLAILPCCAEALSGAPDDIRLVAMRIVFRLFARVWVAIPWEPRREVFDVIGPAVVQIISCENRALVGEGLHFLRLFLENAAADHGDLVDCPSLSDPSNVVLCCKEILQTDDEDLKHKVMPVILLLLEHVWLVRPDEADARPILDDLAECVIDLISTHRGFLVEAGLHFFALFIDQEVYEKQDAESFSWLSDLRDIQYGNSALFHGRLMDYWMSPT